MACAVQNLLQQQKAQLEEVQASPYSAPVTAQVLWITGA